MYLPIIIVYGFCAEPRLNFRLTVIIERHLFVYAFFYKTNTLFVFEIKQTKTDNVLISFCNFL